MTKYLNPLTIPDPNCCKGPELCRNCARKAMDIRNALVHNIPDDDELVYNCPDQPDPDEDADMALNHETPSALLPLPGGD